jgi:hypothetical protein
MKRLILGLAACLTTLGIAGMASAHPPEYFYRPVYRPVIIAPPVIVTPAPIIVTPAPIVVTPIEIVRPVYHGYFWGHHWR